MKSERFSAFRPLLRRVFVPPRGRKNLWLPNFTLTLLHTAHLPPTWAQFIVPLNVNKLDVKDYLWNVYSVPVLSVRSYVQQQPIQNTRPGPGRGVLRRWYRPRSIKRMTVEIGNREDGRGGQGGGIFVWPDLPIQAKDEDSFEAWDKKVFEAVQEYQETAQQAQDSDRSGRIEEHGRNRVAVQAQRLLDGRDTWSSTRRDLHKQDS